jgi:hypothetical protein
MSIHRQHRSTFLIVGIITAATLACPSSAAAQGFGGGRPGQNVTVDFGGGSGGRNVTYATCDPGSVAVGIRVRTGEYLNQAWLECSPLRPDGSLGGGSRVTAPAGQSGGRVENAARCPNGQVLRGLRGQAGSSVDLITGVCASPGEIRDRPQPRSTQTSSVSIPRPGGRPVQAPCPQNAAIVALQAKSGEYMDHLWIQCADLRSFSGGYPGGPGQPGIPGSPWKGDLASACINAVRSRIQQDYGNRTQINLPPAAARVTPVPVGQILVPVNGSGQFSPPGQGRFNTSYSCQIDKRFGTVNNVNYSRPGVQPQPR